MKRYKLMPTICGTTATMEDDDGKWVKFEDVEYIKAAAVAHAVLLLTIDNAKRDGLPAIQPACNCDKMCISPPQGLIWVCPAHGYKKL